jgi:hypothetical protein
MATVPTQVLFKINNKAVPEWARPPRDGFSPVFYPRANGRRDLMGRPGGARGFGYMLLTWEVISARAFRYWAHDIVGDGFQFYEAFGIVVPDPERGQPVNTALQYHSSFRYGVIEKITLEETVRAQYLGTCPVTQRQQVLMGGRATMRISQLGRY